MVSNYRRCNPIGYCSQEKAKVAAPKPTKKEPDELLGYKPELPKAKVESYNHIKEMMNSAYKLRKASDHYPVLLSELANPQGLDADAQLYVQTAFISLAEHNYENALSNLQKAKTLQKISRL